LGGESLATQNLVTSQEVQKKGNGLEGRGGSGIAASPFNGKDEPAH